MNTPTPNPRPERKVIADALAHADDDTASVEPSWVLDDEYYLGQADVVLSALDLPARDARIRAETLREAAFRFPAYSQKSVAVRARLNEMADEFERDGTGKGFPSNAAASAVPAEGSGQRCPSRIAHESGAVLGCQRPVGHWGDHIAGSPLVLWLDDDDRVIGTPETWVRREDCDPDCAGHLPILSNDTPEGDTDRPHEINCHADRETHWIDCECWCHDVREGDTDANH